MEEIQLTILSACITIISLVLFYISLASYKKHNNKRLIFVTSVFCIFLIKGMMGSLSLFIDELSFLQYNLYYGLLDLIMLLLLFIAVIKE